MYEHLLSDTVQGSSCYFSCKLQACQDELFGICYKLVPTLKPIVTDEEQAYVNTPKVTLLKHHLQCGILYPLQLWPGLHRGDQTGTGDKTEATLELEVPGCWIAVIRRQGGPTLTDL